MNATQMAKKQKSEIWQKLTAPLALVIMVIVFSLSSQYFLRVDNIMTIAHQTAVTAITAYGMTFVIVSGCVDLSVGSSIAFSGVLVALMLQKGSPIWLALIVTLLDGALVGGLNGFMVGKMKLPPFIATLGMQMVLRGLAMIVSDAKSVYIQNVPSFKELTHYRIFETIPLPVIYIIVLGVIAAFLLRKTVIGRNVFAVGSNEEAARLSGIQVLKIRIFAYGFSGLMAAAAGIILCSRVTSGQPGIAQGYEANAIASAVIGGASMRGGHGSISGSVLGAFILGVLMNGLNLLNVNQNWQTFATGLVVILAVWVDKMRTPAKS